MFGREIGHYGARLRVPQTFNLLVISNCGGKDLADYNFAELFNHLQ